jgi:hypothetical protein
MPLPLAERLWKTMLLISYRLLHFWTQMIGIGHGDIHCSSSSVEGMSTAMRLRALHLTSSPDILSRKEYCLCHLPILFYFKDTEGNNGTVVCCVNDWQRNHLHSNKKNKIAA